ncbi:Uncharacterised protein [Mycobacterium tuberculosis]|nr:Uncharacterised protein [Mycobacterium tuberculosis]
MTRAATDGCMGPSRSSRSFTVMPSTTAGITR